MPKKILIVDDYDDLRTALTAEFVKMNHLVDSVDNRDDGIKLMESKKFDVIIADLDGENTPSVFSRNGISAEGSAKDTSESRSNVKAFKISIDSFHKSNFNEDQLKYFVETILGFKSKYIDRGGNIDERHEKIEIEVPGVISLMHSILGYLMKRVEKLKLINLEKSNLFVALDEAFVNAVKHGNKFDADKNIRITVDITSKEARFTIEDEGMGFDVHAIPDPTDIENLFKTSGRGVMFMYNIMDEVIYNDRGNRITMIKKRDKPD